MENDKMKTPRASQSRVKETRPKTWTPPSNLDAPPAPDGFRHRWIRTEVLGFDDTKNMSGKIHYLDIQIDNFNLPCSFTIIDNNDIKVMLGLNSMLSIGCII